MTETESSLVLRAQRGERAAFDELVRRSSRLVFARLHLETGNLHQAEDLLQETLLAAYRSLGQLTEPDKFRPWLLRIASNMAINAAKHATRIKRTLPDTSERRGARPTPEESLQQEEQRQQLL